MLLAGEGESALEIGFSSSRVRIGRIEGDFSSDAIDLSLVPGVFGCFDRRRLFTRLRLEPGHHLQGFACLQISFARGR